MGTYRGNDTTGFQSPAQDYVEDVIDLVALLGLRGPGRYPTRFKGQRESAGVVRAQRSETRPG